MEALINLPYTSLAPAVSDGTLSFHHGKHLATYVKNLNAAIEGTPLADLPLEDLIRRAAAEGLTPVFNNAGQTFNHNMYFLQFSPKPAQTEPSGKLAAAIDAAFGSFDGFKKQFAAAAAGLFGSGWAWLQADTEGKLSIAKYSGADNPVAHGFRPVLTFDVWEHAYYLDYQNRRPDYIAALWSVTDWKIIGERYL